MASNNRQSQKGLKKAKDYNIMWLLTVKITTRCGFINHNSLENNGLQPEFSRVLGYRDDPESEGRKGTLPPPPIATLG
jgi:hypothetical protein